MYTAVRRRHYRRFAPALLRQPARTRSYVLAVAQPSSNRRRPLTHAFSLWDYTQGGRDALRDGGPGELWHDRPVLRGPWIGQTRCVDPWLPAERPLMGATDAGPAGGGISSRHLRPPWVW